MQAVFLEMSSSGKKGSRPQLITQDFAAKDY